MRARGSAFRTGGLLLVGAGLALGPALWHPSYPLYVLTLTLVMGVAACGLNLTLGYGGQISLGHAAFMGIGAYAVAILGKRGGEFWPAWGAGIALATAAGIALGVPCLRVRTHYLALLTLAFNVIATLVMVNDEPLTGGPLGISNVPRPRVPGAPPDLALYYVTLAVAAAVAAGERALRASQFGRGLVALRENELRASTVGLSVVAYKVLAFALGAALAGAAGGLLAALTGYVDPTPYTVTQSFWLLLMVVIGGLGHSEGPWLGAAVLTALPEVLRGARNLYLVVFSLLSLALLLMAPGGLASLLAPRTPPLPRRGARLPDPEVPSRAS
jgi:branched-chain amino acid transport system permease protein